VTTGVRRLIAAAALLAAVAPAGSSARAAGATPAVFELVTTGVGVAASSTQRPAASVITGGLVDATLGYSSSALSSAGASASDAAAFYPGDLVATGPSLLCSQFLPCPVTPPDYPLLAQASYPERPSGSADSPAPAGTAHALAGESSTDGVAELSSATAPGAPVTVSVAAESVSTRSWVDGTGAHVRSRSVLHDVVIGALHVATIDAVDDVDVRVAGQLSDRPRITITGVTVAGQAAAVDQDGIHLLGVHQPAAVPVVAGQGVEVRTIGVDRADTAGAARSSAGGLRVTFSVPVSGVPAVVPGAPGVNRVYVGSLVVGGVGAAVAAGGADDALLASLPTPDTSSLTAALLPARDLGTQPAGAATQRRATAPVTAAPPTLAARVRDLLPQADLTTLALVLAIVPPSLLLLWRWLVLARRTSG
jgi:hypothetical protein